MKQILPSDIVRACERHDLKLVAGTFRLINHCCCPLTAMYIDAVENPEIGYDGYCDAPMWANKKYGVDYASGFAYGFDDSYVVKLKSESEQYRIGYSDGQTARNKLLLKLY